MKVLTIAESLGEGIISLPKTLWQGVERTAQDVGISTNCQQQQTADAIAECQVNSLEEVWG